MKKTFAFLAALLLSLAAAHDSYALQQPDASGTKVVTVQAGALPGFGATVSGNIVLTPVGAGHLYGGLQLGANVSRGTTATRTDLSLAPRLCLGWNLSQSMEMHLGTLAGIAVRHITENRLQFCYGGFGGFRFNLSPSLGLVVEGCYSPQLPYASAGLSFKF